MANHMRIIHRRASSVDLKNISTLRAIWGAQIRRAHDRPITARTSNRKSVIILVVAAIVALAAVLYCSLRWH